MDLHHYRPNRVFIYFKKLAKEVNLKMIDVNYFSTPGGWQSIILLAQKT